MKTKILKVKVGELYEDGKAKPVFKTFFQKESKAGAIYYEAKELIFVGEVEKKDEVPKFTQKLSA